MSAAFYVVLALLIITLVVLFLFLFRETKRKKALKEEYGYVPEHTELYFEEYFDDIIKEWDLVREDEAQRWAEKMSERLDDVSEKLDSVKSRKREIDSDMETIENKIEKIEE